MGFLNFQTPVSFTPSQIWANDAAAKASVQLNSLFVLTRNTYDSLWATKTDDPQSCMDRIAALGSGARAAFTAHAAAVQYLLTVLPLFDGTADMITQAQTWTLPAGWTINFNPDGSANVTPPTQSSTGV